MSYRDVLEAADRHFAAVMEAQPQNLQCGRGCSFCCYGLFEIGSSDVAIITDALKSAPAELREALVQRSREIVDKTAHPDIRSMDPAEKEAWFTSVGSVPCPALGDDGLCTIYESRPVICRTFGLPIREGDEYIGDICELNFTGASDEERQSAAWDIAQEDPVDEAEQYTIPEAILMADRMLGLPDDASRSRPSQSPAKKGRGSRRS